MCVLLYAIEKRNKRNIFTSIFEFHIFQNILHTHIYIYINSNATQAVCLVEGWETGRQSEPAFMAPWLLNGIYTINGDIMGINQ